jgi:hypothetical protein
MRKRFDDKSRYNDNMVASPLGMKRVIERNSAACVTPNVASI